MRKPSPATAMAFVALLVSLGGTSYAAFGPFKGDKIIKNHSLSGKKLKDHTVTGNQLKLSQIGKVPNATNADTAASAVSANNANALGGIAPSGYTHSDCNSQTGQLKGWAVVEADSTFSSSFTTVSGYNCSGGVVQAKRIGQGDYEVKFSGSPVTIAVVTVNGPSTTSYKFDTANVRRIGPGDFEVFTDDAIADGLFDNPFAIIAP